MEERIDKRPIKIAITGPESTGKSFMATKLASVFGGIVIGEYARIYLNKTSPKYTLNDIERIAVAQAALENSYLGRGSNFLFCDTDMLVCKIWAEHVFGYCPESIAKLYHEQQYDLTLLMDIDIPWIPDSLRENPDDREAILSKYKYALKQSGRSFFLVSGTEENRLKNAIDIIRKQFNIESSSLNIL